MTSSEPGRSPSRHATIERWRRSARKLGRGAAAKASSISTQIPWSVGVLRLARAGAILSAGFAAGMADIGSRSVVPGANDNGTGVVALIALARALAQRPTESVRVMLVSTSEEGTCEGMRLFAERHFETLPAADTFFLAIDTVGSPHLLLLRGEGMLGVTEYPARSLELIDGLAEELDIWLFPNLRERLR